MPTVFKGMADVKTWMNYGVAAVILWVILYRVVIPNFEREEAYQQKQFEAQEKFRDSIIEVNKDQASSTRELASIQRSVVESLGRIEAYEREHSAKADEMVRALKKIQEERGMP